MKYFSVLFTFLLMGCVGDPPPVPQVINSACAGEALSAFGSKYQALLACEARMGYPEHPRPRWAIPFNTNNWGISPLMY